MPDTTYNILFRLIPRYGRHLTRAESDLLRIYRGDLRATENWFVRYIAPARGELLKPQRRHIDGENRYDNGYIHTDIYVGVDNVRLKRMFSGQ